MIIYHLIILYIGSETEISINKLTKLIVNLIGYNGKIVYDKSNQWNFEKFMSKKKNK